MNIELLADSEKPLVSFVIFAYKQEKYIREAILAAFAQTYSPLEIILSDDCSPDDTFEIMREMASNYSGPHKVIINSNPTNLHVGGHINRVMQIASGEWIVGAAGDDVSEPHRVDEIVQCFLASGKAACSIYSDATYMDELGNLTGYYSVARGEGYFEPVSYAKSDFHGVLGASHAWHSCLFERFGPLPSEITYEDDVIPFRAALLGTIAHIPRALVKYRRHETTIMRQSSNLIENQLFHQNRLIMVCDSNLKDLLNYSTFVDQKYIEKDACFDEIVNRRNISRHIIKILSGELTDRC